MIGIAQIGEAQYGLYDAIPSRLAVPSLFRVEPIEGGLSGLRIIEQPVAEPYVKAYGEGGPTTRAALLIGRGRSTSPIGAYSWPVREASRWPARRSPQAPQGPLSTPWIASGARISPCCGTSAFIQSIAAGASARDFFAMPWTGRGVRGSVSWGRRLRTSTWRPVDSTLAWAACWGQSIDSGARAARRLLMRRCCSGMLISEYDLGRMGHGPTARREGPTGWGVRDVE